MNEPLPPGPHLHLVPRILQTSANTMCHHLQLYKLAPASIDHDDNQEEESNIDDNGEDDDDFMFG